MNAASRQALMQKLARIDTAPVAPQIMCVNFLMPISYSCQRFVNRMRPTIAQTMTSKSVLLKNMFDPEEYVVQFTKLGDAQRFLLTEKANLLGTKNWLKT